MLITAKIRDVSKFVDRLKSLSSVAPGEIAKRQEDTYLVSPVINDKSLCVQITRYGLRSTAVFTSRSRDAHIARRDNSEELIVSSPDRLEDILLDAGYTYDVQVDRISDTFHYKNLSIRIDNVRELGYLVQIEVSDSDKAKRDSVVDEILKDLAIEKEDVFSPSEDYVTLMRERELQV